MAEAGIRQRYRFKKTIKNMNFKYYDLLSSLILGNVFLFVVIVVTGGEYKSDYHIPYLALSFVIGYLLNAIGSLMEWVYNKSIGGRPSDVLLTINPQKPYTGYCRIKFYEAEKCVKLLRRELGDENANTKKMFDRAMMYSANDKDSRVQDFNAQYAFSRTLLTTVLLLTPVVAYGYNHWYSCLGMALLIALTWNRFKECGYYYAKEVLTYYLKVKDVAKIGAKDDSGDEPSCV